MPDQGGSKTPAGRAAALRRRRSAGAHRADQGLSGSPGRYAALVALLAGLASLPTWAVVQAGTRSLASGDTSPRPPGAGGSSVPIIVIPPGTRLPGPTPPGVVTADSVYQPAPTSGFGGAATVAFVPVNRKPLGVAKGRPKVPSPQPHAKPRSDPPDQQESRPVPPPAPRQRTGGQGATRHVGKQYGVAWRQNRAHEEGHPTWSVKKTHHQSPVPPRKGGKRT